MKKYGRGGVLALGSVLAAQSGASRTSPVLRGNWLVETLLGEKTPKPPANVPRLPDEETGGENLTVRQMVEKHAHVAECAVCHERIDPFGFALEKYDAIGRLREVDLAGRPIATDARLKDGTQFDGLDGLRKYLVEQRKDIDAAAFLHQAAGLFAGPDREPVGSAAGRRDDGRAGKERLSALGRRVADRAKQAVLQPSRDGCYKG